MLMSEIESGCWKTRPLENGRKNFALGSRTSDFLRSGGHFLSPNFGCFEKKGVFQHPLAMALTDQIGTARIVDKQEVIRYL